MADPVTISPSPSSNKGLDYSALKADGIAIIQSLAGEVWTDYNEHDPGVTALEQLCYGLTELSYRAEFSVKDLLTHYQDDKIDEENQALFRPEQILPCNPVTTDDYRKLILDRINGVGNVWLTPCQSEFAINGLYHISLYMPSNLCSCEAPDSARHQVKELYSKHRDLCEDLASIRILVPRLTRVNAKVFINNSSSPELILASIFFQLGLLLAPEVERTSLQAALDEGASAEMIFNGPLLLNGLIDDAQLQGKLSCLALSEIANSIALVNGVIGVNDLFVTFPNETEETGKKSSWGSHVIPIPDDIFLQLDTQASGNKNTFSIQLYRDGICVQVNRITVNRELEKLWKNYRRTYNLESEYAQYFAFPKGHYRDVRQYYSIQNQFPNLYGINQYGIVNNTLNKVRPAQAKQFKGYLLVFDQILANFFAQLERVKDLYSVNPALKHSYFYQYLDKSVPDVEPLLKKLNACENYHTGLPKIIHAQDNFVERRNRFLDVVLALYGQSLEQIGTSPVDSESQNAKELIQAKISWLQQLVVGTCERGRAFDYLGRASKNNIAGMEIKIRIQLGMEVSERVPLSQLCSELGIEIVEENEHASIGRRLESYSDYIEGEFSSFTAIDGEDSFSEKNIWQNINILKGQRVTEEFLQAASDVTQFRVVTYLDKKGMAVICQSPLTNEWHFVETCNHHALAKTIIYEMVEATQKLYRNSWQIYLVEHILLRFSLDDPEEINTLSLGSNFDYSFTLSAVVSINAEQRRSLTYQKMVCEVIRENTPTHIALDFCFISSYALCRFESLYWAWRAALKVGGKAKCAATSTALEHFLRIHRVKKPIRQVES